MITKNLISIMLQYGMYSTMTIDPIAYHGYRETIENLQNVIEEIDVEILLRPQDADKLLDHRISLQKRLDVLNELKTKSMPALIDLNEGGEQ